MAGWRVSTTRPEHHAKQEQVAARSREFARIYDALITRNEVVALVSSHVDYNNFGLAVEAAIRNDVPVLFPQSTGGLKAYALFPEQVLAGSRSGPGSPTRSASSSRTHIWANRELLQRSRELTMWRAKATLGRPAWWRARKQLLQRRPARCRRPLGGAHVRRPAHRGRSPPSP